MLTLGVPGSGTTAVLLALLLTLNITPGPLLFTERPDVVWGLMAALLIANIVLLVLNVPMVKIFVKVLSVPPGVLLPGVTMVSFVGIYSLSGSWFDLLLMIAFGILGYLLRKLDVPTVPIILGILLGNAMEDALRRAMVLSGGDWTFLFSTKIATGFWIAAVAGFVAPVFLRRFVKPPKGPRDGAVAPGAHGGLRPRPGRAPPRSCSMRSRCNDPAHPRQRFGPAGRARRRCPQGSGKCEPRLRRDGLTRLRRGRNAVEKELTAMSPIRTRSAFRLRLATAALTLLLVAATGSAPVSAQSAAAPDEDAEALRSQDSAYSVFLLIKATPAWLALSPDARFGWLDKTVQPILAEHPEVSMRFWDVEHFSARASDVILFETARLDRYMSLVEALRETRFWDAYFLVLDVLPGIENAYAEAYDRPAY